MARTCKNSVTATTKTKKGKQKLSTNDIAVVQEEEVPKAEVSVVIPVRPKRRPKTPKGRLGRAPSVTKQRAPSSSLPPSSPPPIGRILTPPRYHHNEQLQHIIEEEVSANGSGGHDFEHHPAEEDDEEEEFKAANTSDPFGFLAVERKIKQQRTLYPKPNSMDEDFEEVPTTPHKQKLGKPAVPASPSICLSNFSFPSTPSPEKVPHKRSASNAAAQIGDKENEDQTITVKRKPKKKRRDTVDPESLDLNLRALLPKSNLRSRQALRKPRTKVSGDTKVGRRMGTRSRRVEEDCEEIEFENNYNPNNDDSEARREYFNDLADYSFEKENVYVI